MPALPDDTWTHRIVGGPWPERIGLRCRIVTKPDGINTYPWVKTRQLVVLVEDDPFRKPNQTADWYVANYGAEWTCAIRPSDVELIG